MLLYIDIKVVFMDEKQNKLIDFFKLVDLYNKKAFDYINNNLINLYDKKTKDKLVEYGINIKLKEKKLKGFSVVAPIITNERTMLINIYLYAKALYYYGKFGKRISDENTMEILPITLVRIYSELNLDNNTKKKINNFEECKAVDTMDEKLLLAYDLQFFNFDNYIKTGTLLIPESFYVDDVNSLKESCLRKLKGNGE